MRLGAGAVGHVNGRGERPLSVCARATHSDTSVETGGVGDISAVTTNLPEARRFASSVAAVSAISLTPWRREL